MFKKGNKAVASKKFCIDCAKKFYSTEDLCRECREGDVLLNTLATSNSQDELLKTLRLMLQMDDERNMD